MVPGLSAAMRVAPQRSVEHIIHDPKLTYFPILPIVKKWNKKVVKKIIRLHCLVAQDA